MDVRRTAPVPRKQVVENNRPQLRGQQLYRVWQRGGEQILIHQYPQRRSLSIQKFKELIAGLFDSVMTDLGLDQQLLLELIDKGLQSKNKKVFDQLLYI